MQAVENTQKISVRNAFEYQKYIWSEISSTGRFNTKK